MIEGKNLPDYLSEKIEALENEIGYKRTRMIATKDLPAKRVLKGELKQMEDDYYKLISIATEAAKNGVVDLFSTNLAEPKNRTDLLTPISFLRVAGLKTKNINDFYNDIATSEDLLEDLVNAGIITVQC